ncbi:glucose-1-phosphate adenylyltransferase [Aureliella helgolandensis]|uniref:Glucose-1-phosphate adenylyltransferase n=1 Tax=Aureliella helgolandensis TaxID=2527968 RepID=A0A518G1X1_9BACT|nr:glucose-1-phosphate adenylyltransferase [Aureliella helgolandensis]QDV22606.1 Glucose-1-phosphate adenylyltransferase [Aureliella helgolandensis]
MIDVNPRSVLALILGGGRGSRLYPLTKIRAKPSVPLAAKYRLIDIPISNCINSNINQIFVLTQFLSNSLHGHIRQTYRFDHFSGGFVELLAAQQTMEGGTDWYEGTADAVRKNLENLDQRGVEYVLILSGDQLYRMDYRAMLKTHIESKADVTIAAIPVDRKEAHALGIMRCDETGKVTGFLEKPKSPEEIDLVKMDPKWIDSQGVESNGRDCLASMGLYIFNRDLLFDVLEKTPYQDFGKEVFPAAIRSKHVQVHMFDDYWEDIGTIRAFYEANLQLAKKNPPFDLVCPEAPVYSRPRFLPPAIIEGAQISGSLIADGCRIGKGTVIENSVIGLRCLIGEGVTIRNSIIMGSDFYDTDQEVQAHVDAGRPPVGIGAGSVIEGAILDKNCQVGKNVVVKNKSGADSSDEFNPCLIRDGIPVLVKEGVLPDGWSMG